MNIRLRRGEKRSIADFFSDFSRDLLESCACKCRYVRVSMGKLRKRCAMSVRPSRECMSVSSDERCERIPELSGSEDEYVHVRSIEFFCRWQVFFFAMKKRIWYDYRTKYHFLFLCLLTIHSLTRSTTPQKKTLMNEIRSHNSKH